MEECFSRFLNCTNGTKSRNASQITFCWKLEHRDVKEGIKGIV